MTTTHEFKKAFREMRELRAQYFEDLHRSDARKEAARVRSLRTPSDGILKIKGRLV